MATREKPDLATLNRGAFVRFLFVIIIAAILKADRFPLLSFLCLLSVPIAWVCFRRYAWNETKNTTNNRILSFLYVGASIPVFVLFARDFGLF
jgi:hypothetical protein